jgi:hypothetical protein
MPIFILQPFSGFQFYTLQHLLLNFLGILGLLAPRVFLSQRRIRRFLTALPKSEVGRAAFRKESDGTLTHEDNFPRNETRCHPRGRNHSHAWHAVAALLSETISPNGWLQFWQVIIERLIAE